MDIKRKLRKSLLKEDLAMNKGHMEDTENFPMDISNGQKHGERKRTVNKLAGENFETKFNDKYQDLLIYTNDGLYKFSQVKLLNNSGWYGLWFVQPVPESTQEKHILIKKENGEPYIENHYSNDKIELEPEAKKDVLDMLKYNH